MDGCHHRCGDRAVLLYLIFDSLRKNEQDTCEEGGLAGL